jgi:hypothetical protein
VPEPTKVEDPTTVVEGADKEQKPATLDASAGPARVSAKNLLRHPDAHPIVLDLLLIKKYGAEWLSWEPETFGLVLPRDFQADVSELNLTKIQALKTLHLVDDYWLRWEVFTWLTMALNGVFPDFDLLQVPTAAQCMVSVDIANRIRTDASWSEEVKLFLGVVHHHDGVFAPQEPLEFVKVPTEGYPIDVGEILKRWPEVRSSGRAPGDDTVTAEQLRRMLTLHGYLEESRARLQHQMHLLPSV